MSSCRMSHSYGSPQSLVYPQRRQMTLQRSSNVGPPQTSHGSAAGPVVGVAIVVAVAIALPSPGRP